MTLTRSQIERLGFRLVRSDLPADEDLADLHDLLLAYGDVLADAAARVQRHLGMVPSSRVKTTGTILDKLERYGGSWLKSIQDIAGMRIVGTFDRRGQDALADRLVELFANSDRAPRVVDRRKEPSHGYRALHVVVFVRSLPVEIQIRTQLQHEWADLFEKLADKIGRGIRYGDRPKQWLTKSEREALPASDRDRHDRMFRKQLRVLTIAHLLARAIDGHELTEVREPDAPGLSNVRESIESVLEALDRMLNEPAFESGESGQL